MIAEYKTSHNPIAIENEQLKFALQAAGVGTWYLDPVSHQVYLDDRCKELYGFPKDEVVTYEKALIHNHPDDQALVDRAVQFALDPHLAAPYDIIHRTIGACDGRLRWLRCQGKAYFNEKGLAYRFSGVSQDITHDIEARRQLEVSEGRFRNLIEEAPVATCLLIGRDLKIEVANEVMIRYWDKDASVIGKPLAELLSELRGQLFLQILDDVFTTGKTYEARAAEVVLKVNGVLDTYFFDFTYKPLRNSAGEVYAIMIMAIDVTEAVKSRKKLEESELYSRSIIENSPVAKIVFWGDDLVINTINEKMMEMIGRDASIIGKSFGEAIPELATTPLMDKLRTVYRTGETYHIPEGKFAIIKNNEAYIGYYRFTYKALYNTTGKIYGIVHTAVEVTEQVQARQQIAEAEESLRGAVELAELGTWSVDPLAQTITYDDRMKHWLGLTKDELLFEEAMVPVVESDRERVLRALQTTLQPQSEGVYDQEYLIENGQTGQRRIIHAQAKALFDPQGVVYRLVGTAQDITEQRQIQLALEQEVQKRTEELEETNKELAAINEEIAATNEELAESNQLLTRTNRNLEQFAYVASHDLQEPLRKIQSFGDILKNRYTTALGDGITYLERIQGAASRMSNLIHDLLMFSRISTRQEATDQVSLNEVVCAVLADLDLTIQETGAIIDVDGLPTVQGDPSQLGQLFLNLMTNALKFRRAGIAPHIQISYQLIPEDGLPLSAKPARVARLYHCIKVADDGIGFENKYIDRIFQVFQRLHGKLEYAGTGIGLAICEKVVVNHGGAITAVSQPGQGATFHIYLPVLVS